MAIFYSRAAGILWILINATLNINIYFSNNVCRLTGLHFKCVTSVNETLYERKDSMNLQSSNCEQY